MGDPRRDEAAQAPSHAGGHPAEADALRRQVDDVAQVVGALLTAISGYARLVRDRLGEGHPLRNEVERIDEAACRGAALLEQLAAAGREPSPRPAALDANSAAADTAARLRRADEGHTELPENSPP